MGKEWNRMSQDSRLNAEVLLPFVSFQTARSGGSGGQHVNKVETKVTLWFDLGRATIFSDQEKERIRHRLGRRILADGRLAVVSQDTRSQLNNKEIAIQRLITLLREALKTHKARKPTQPSKAAVQRRLDGKRQQALRKINRKKDWL